MRELVFVYGTLKRGFPNFERGGMARHLFRGRARTVQAWPLVVGGRWMTPYLLTEPGEGHRVLGELFAVDRQGLARLDAFEGVHLPDMYQRRRIEVCALAAPEQVIEAWTYMHERARIRGKVSAPTPEYRRDPRYVTPDRR